MPGYSMIIPCGWSIIDDVDFIFRFQYSSDPSSKFLPVTQQNAGGT